MTSSRCTRQSQGTYSADDIVTLDGLEPVRRRPGMYIGSLDADGLHVLATTLLDIAVRETLSEAGPTIRVELLADGGLHVRFGGPGIPTDLVPRVGLPFLEMVFTRFFSGFPYWVGGLHGTGVCVVNALSSRLLVETVREGQRWRQRFVRGQAATPLEAVGPCSTPGTVVTFWPDPEVFTGAPDFSFDRLRDELSTSAICSAGLVVRLADHRPGREREWTFSAPRGLADRIEVLSRETAAALTGTLCEKAVTPGGEVEVAFRWVADDALVVEGYVNGRRLDRGTHRRGLLLGIGRAFRGWHGRPWPHPGFEPTHLGLRAAVSVTVEEPQYNSARREALNNIEIEEGVATFVEAVLSGYLRDRSNEAGALLDHFLEYEPPAPPRKGKGPR